MNHFEISNAGLALTKSFKGLRLTAYQDVAGIWTIGYGHAGADVHEGMTITEADALLRGDLADAEACVNRSVTAAISQNQFDALVDFCFNAGQGNFLHSTLLKKVNANDFAEAAAQFGLWVHVGGEVVPGLVRRRKAEAGDVCNRRHCEGTKGVTANRVGIIFKAEDFLHGQFRSHPGERVSANHLSARP
jgi:lysozyme